ncbi:MAG: HEAT repeat domain-containing protein, partial [Isosphaeraceae bacterium]
LGSRTATPKILDRLLKMLAARDKMTRRHAEYPFMGGIQEAHVPDSFLDELARLLADQDENMRRSVASVAARLAGDEAGPRYLSWLARLLVDPDSKARESAASVVGSAGPAVAKAEILGPLGRLLEDPDDRVRRSAAKAVGELGAPASAILQGIADRLNDPVWEIRDAATWSVVKLGDVAATPPMLERLSTMLKAWGSNNRKAALYATEAIGTAAARPAILESLVYCLADDDVEIRRKAVEVVRKMGAGAATIQFANLIEAYRNRIPSYSDFPPSSEIADILIFLMQYGLRYHRVIIREIRKRSVLWWKEPIKISRTRLAWVTINEPGPHESPSRAGS